MEPNPHQAVQEKVRKLVDRIQGLPTLPVMMTNINQMILNPRTSPKEVAHVISNDPSLTSKVLRVVNSSFYGFPNRITTITHAIVILGFNTIKSIVLSSTIFDVFRRTVKPGDFDRTQFWKHSIGCGAAAKAIGRRLNYPMLEELFIAGLLHDVGKIVMDQYMPDKFAEVVNVVHTRDCLISERSPTHPQTDRAADLVPSPAARSAAAAIADTSSPSSRPSLPSMTLFPNSPLSFPTQTTSVPACL